MHRFKKNNKVESAVPCGNPKRYGSKDVVHMPLLESQDRKRKSGSEVDDSTASESEKHLKTLLNHQIKKDVTLTEQFSQHRSFTMATSHDPGVEKLIGVQKYEKYKSVSDLDNRIDFLRHCGLDDEEITLKLMEEMKDQVPIKFDGFGMDPQSKQQKLEEIERKIQDKAASLKVPDSFKGALELSRQALELERSMRQRQGRESSRADIITIQKKPKTTHPDDPVNHIPQILNVIERKSEREPRRERRRRRKLERKKLYYESLENKMKATSSSQVLESAAVKSDENKEDDKIQQLLGLKIGVESAGNLTAGQLEPSHITAENVTARYNTLPGLYSQNQNDLDKKCDKVLHGKLAVQVSESETRNISSPVNDSSMTLKTVNKPVRFIPEDEIMDNRLSLEEIRAIDKFKNYTQGEPNKVVYVKNLPNKISEEDLIALFGPFQSEDKPKIVFKLLSGRMKGQAFITFPDELTASRAVSQVNGYKFQDKPIILSFGKKY